MSVIVLRVRIRWQPADTTSKLRPRSGAPGGGGRSLTRSPPGSFFVLFRRHSLLNALLYIGVWFSSLFNFVFPVYSLAGDKLTPTWYAIDIPAHFAMALTAWSMPGLWEGILPRLRFPARAGVRAGVAVLAILPAAG